MTKTANTLKNQRLFDCSHAAIVFLLIFLLSGCQTPEERSAEEADKFARVVSDFIVSRQELPADIAALRAYDGGSYGVRWNRFASVSCHLVPMRGVRVDFIAVTGASDYRILYINPPPLFLGATNSAGFDTNNFISMATDPKSVLIFNHFATNR